MADGVYLWKLLADGVESLVVTCFMFSRLNLSQKGNKRLSVAAVALLFTVLMSLSRLLQLGETPAQLMLYLFRLIAAMRLFCNPAFEKIFVSCLPGLLSMLARQLTYTVGIFVAASRMRENIFITADNPLSLDYLSDYPVAGTLVYLFYEFVLIALFARLLDRLLCLPSAGTLFLVVVTVVALVSTVGFLDAMAISDYWPLTVPRRLRLNALCFIVLFFFLAMVFLVQVIGSSYRRNLALIEQMHRDEMMRERSRALLQSAESLRQWKHDYKNHLAVMQELLAGGRYDQLREYICAQEDGLPQSFYVVSTGHSIIDAILIRKYADARAEDISFVYAVILPDKIPLSDIEVTGVLGNLLDNAAEACRMCRQTQGGGAPRPSIQVNVRPQRGMLHISVKNTSNGRYCYDDQGELETAKEEKAVHGNGLRQVRAIADSHGGFCRIVPGETDFTVDVFIPLEKQEGTA